MGVVKMRWAKADNSGLFIISEDEAGALYASRDESPFFMVSGETEEDVRRQAFAAIASYFTMTRTITKDQVEAAAREIAASLTYEEVFMPASSESTWELRGLDNAALAAAKAFGLSVEGE